MMMMMMMMMMMIIIIIIIIIILSEHPICQLQGYIKCKKPRKDDTTKPPGKRKENQKEKIQYNSKSE